MRRLDRGVELREHQSHEPAVELSVENLLVGLREDLIGRDSRAHEVPHFRADSGHHQGGRHSVAGDVTEYDCPPARRPRLSHRRPDGNIIVEIAADLLHRPVTLPERVTGNIGPLFRQQCPLDLPGRCP